MGVALLVVVGAAIPLLSGAIGTEDEEPSPLLVTAGGDSEALIGKDDAAAGGVVFPSSTCSVRRAGPLGKGISRARKRASSALIKLTSSSCRHHVECKHGYVALAIFTTRDSRTDLPTNKCNDFKHGLVTIP